MARVTYRVPAATGTRPSPRPGRPARRSSPSRPPAPGHRPGRRPGRPAGQPRATEAALQEIMSKATKDPRHPRGPGPARRRPRADRAAGGREAEPGGPGRDGHLAVDFTLPPPVAVNDRPAGLDPAAEIDRAAATLWRWARARSTSGSALRRRRGLPVLLGVGTRRADRLPPSCGVRRRRRPPGPRSRMRPAPTCLRPPPAELELLAPEGDDGQGDRGDGDPASEQHRADDVGRRRLSRASLGAPTAGRHPRAEPEAQDPVASSAASPTPPPRSPTGDGAGRKVERRRRERDHRTAAEALRR